MTTTAQDPIAALDQAQAAVQAAVIAASAPPNASVGNVIAGWTPTMVQFLAIAILIFTFSALLLGAILLWRSRAGGTQVLRVFGVLTIIGVSAFLLVVGYSNEQLTPIVGLFGAIAGYLLGKDVQRQGSAQAPERET